MATATKHATCPMCGEQLPYDLGQPNRIGENTVLFNVPASAFADLYAHLWSAHGTDITDGPIE